MPENSAARPGQSTTAPPDRLATVTPQDSARPANSAGTEEPTEADAFYARGEQRARRREFALAVQDFNEVIKREPKNARALNDRCWLRALLDEMQAALKDCNLALQIAPNFSDALDSRGFVYLKLGFYKKSIADYTASLKEFREGRASALYGRGIARRRSGDAVEAKGDIDLAKVYDPKIANEFASYGIQ
jgi:tetratricopeptide (TPR) repeat protein